MEVAQSCAEGRLEWTNIGSVLEKKMPHTAWYMLEHYLKTGRYTDSLYAGATVEGGVVFTPLTEF